MVASYYRLATRRRPRLKKFPLAVIIVSEVVVCAVWNLSSAHRVAPVVPARKTGGNRSFPDSVLGTRWNDRRGPENLDGTTGTTYFR